MCSKFSNTNPKPWNLATLQNTSPPFQPVSVITVMDLRAPSLSGREKPVCVCVFIQRYSLLESDQSNNALIVYFIIGSICIKYYES